MGVRSVSINLLPWRKITKQQAQQRLCYQLLCSSGATLLIFIVLHTLFFYKLRQLQPIQRDIMTPSQINLLDATLRDQQQRLARLNLILKQKDVADKATTQYLTILQHIVEALPQQIVLEKIQKIKSEITLAGQSTDTLGIHQYTTQLVKALPKEKVTLLEMSAYENHYIHFTVKINAAV